MCGSFCSFCGHCGREVGDVIGFKVCQECRFKNPLEAAACENCGAALHEVKRPHVEQLPPPGISITEADFEASCEKRAVRHAKVALSQRRK